MIRKIRWIVRNVLLATVIGCGMCGLTVRAQETEDNIFSEEEREYVEQENVLKVGYVQDRVPVSFIDEKGELGGSSRYIFDRIAEISGLKFKYVALPTGEVTYDYLAGEKFDLVTSVEYNQENQKARGILMSDPYLSSRKVMVAKEGLGISENAHLKVAISTGSQTIKKVLRDQYPNYEIVDFNSIEACFEAVDSGKADILIQNQFVAEYWLYKPLFQDLQVIPIMGIDDQMCFSAVTDLEGNGKDQKEKELLISILNKSIAQISDAETTGYIIRSTMENKYEYTLTDFLYYYRYIIMVLTVAFSLIVILLYISGQAKIQSFQAKAEAKARGTFLSTMSHEIRTPLNGLIGLQNLMFRNLDNKEKMEKYLHQSSFTANYLLSLVNNILDMSKLRESDLVLEYKPVDLELLISTVEIMEKGSMEDKQLDFRMDADLICSVIRGDEVRIQQILINMIDNARKYTPRGGKVTVTLRQTKAEHERIMTKIEVADTGCGISEEFQKRIFDPFTQERHTISKGNQGTGLGMAISYLLARRMNGDLSVVSKLGEGSCFTFWFLAEKAQKQQSVSAPIQAADGEQSLGEKKPSVLIVEDNEMNSEILAELLREEGFVIAQAENGKRALELFQASLIGEYGVILMDLLMPEMDGFETAKAIRALKREDAGTVKIFACTANSFKEDRDKAMDCGMDDFITKPIDIEELLQKLAHYYRG